MTSTLFKSLVSASFAIALIATLSTTGFAGNPEGGKMSGMGSGCHMMDGTAKDPAPATDVSPERILRQQESLKLTPEQTANLAAIQKQAQEQAKAVLTDEQRTKLADVPAATASGCPMMQMHAQSGCMMGKMGGMMGMPDQPAAAEKQGMSCKMGMMDKMDSDGMTCPMGSMKGASKDEGATTQPSALDAHQGHHSK